MRSRFPAGRLHTCPQLLASLPRPVFVAAMVHHFTQEPREGAIRTDHAHNGTRFHIETQADRAKSVIRLSRET